MTVLMKRGLIVWMAASLFYLYEMILRVSPSVMTSQLMESFGISSVTLGFVISFYYFSYSALQIPCGMIVDKYGPRKIITISSIICTFGAFLFAMAEHVWVVQLARFLMGAGSACAFLSTLKLNASWFLPSQFALITGLTVMMGKLGGASQALMSRAVKFYGWEHTVFGLGCIGVFVTLVGYFLIQDKPDDKYGTKETEELNEKYDISLILKSKPVWVIGIVGGLMYIPITGFAELWAVPYMMTVCSIDSGTASDISALLYFGFSMGSPIFAVISRKLNCHLLAMKLSCFLSMLIFGFICFFPNWISLTMMHVLFFMGGACMAGQVLSFTVAKENTDLSVGGTTIGVTNTIVMLSGLIFQPLIGGILDMAWDGNISETGIRIYSKSAYQIAAISIPIGMFICLVLLRLLRRDKLNKE